MSKELIMQPQIWGTIREQGTVLMHSGMLPSTIKRPEAAVAIIMKGYELGMQPMQAFAHINVIQGKPTLSSEGMLAQIWKAIPNAFIDFVRTEDEYCEIHAARPKCTPRKFVFQKIDAQRAGLDTKDNWKKWPRAMYKARCIAEMARTIFPDALMGCSHTAEELNPDLAVNEDGEIIEAVVVERKPEPQVITRETPEQMATAVKAAFHAALTERGYAESGWPAVEAKMKEGKRKLSELDAVLSEMEHEAKELAIPTENT